MHHLGRLFMTWSYPIIIASSFSTHLSRSEVKKLQLKLNTKKWIEMIFLFSFFIDVSSFDPSGHQPTKRRLRAEAWTSLDFELATRSWNCWFLCDLSVYVSGQQENNICKYFWLFYVFFFFSQPAAVGIVFYENFLCKLEMKTSQAKGLSNANSSSSHEWDSLSSNVTTKLRSLCMKLQTFAQTLIPHVLVIKYATQFMTRLPLCPCALI